MEQLDARTGRLWPRWSKWPPALASIADVLGQQERTVARRGNKLLESGVVRTNSFINPSSVSSRSAFLLRVTAAPRELRRICSWLAAQSPASARCPAANEAVAELFISPDELGGLLYRRLAEVEGIESFTMTPLLEYFRTPSGWTPGRFTKSNTRLSIATRHCSLAGIRTGQPAASLDENERSNRRNSPLHRNGRATVDELASELSCVQGNRQPQAGHATSSGALFIRAVVDPASLAGSPWSPSSLLSALAQRQTGRERSAALPVTRWAAASV